MDKGITTASIDQMTKSIKVEVEFTEQPSDMTRASSKKQEAEERGGIQKPTISGPPSDQSDQNRDCLPMRETDFEEGSGRIELGDWDLHSHSPESGPTTGQQLKIDSPKSGQNHRELKRADQKAEVHFSGDPQNTVPSYSGDEYTRELMRQLEAMHEKDKDFRKLINKQRGKISKQDEDILTLLREKSRLESTLHDTKLELHNARQDILNNEAVVTKAHTMVVSNLASDVSNNFPDDVVRQKLEAFFQNDFFSWCSDLCVPEIEDPEKADKFIRSTGLLNDSEFYNNAPGFMKFDIQWPDGAASLPLLQAALSASLCQHFLTFPYFLADLGSNMGERSRNPRSFVLEGLEAAIGKDQADVAIDWRVETVAAMERSIPMTKDTAKTLAGDFMEQYGFLVKMDEYEEAEDELVGFYVEFADLALQLWKKKGNIEVKFMSDLGNEGFQWKSNKADGEARAVSKLGKELEGRPMGLLMRPLVVWKPLIKPGQEAKEVVWLKAMAWLSSRSETGEDGE